MATNMCTAMFRRVHTSACTSFLVLAQRRTDTTTTTTTAFSGARMLSNLMSAFVCTAMRAPCGVIVVILYTLQRHLRGSASAQRRAAISRSSIAFCCTCSCVCAYACVSTRHTRTTSPSRMQSGCNSVPTCDQTHNGWSVVGALRRHSISTTTTRIGVSR